MLCCQESKLLVLKFLQTQFLETHADAQTHAHTDTHAQAQRHAHAQIHAQKHHAYQATPFVSVTELYKMITDVCRKGIRVCIRCVSARQFADVSRAAAFHYSPTLIRWR